jgi:3D (Asp-Asp-Asp) domain-containing protein
MTFKKLKKDIIPLGEYQQAIIFLVIACVFQFLLFFSPQLVTEAVARDFEANLSLSSISKTSQPNQLVIDYMKNNKLINIPYIIIEEEEKIIIEEEIIEEIVVLRTSIHTLTAYNSLPEQTNDQPCITANGFNVCEHGIEDTIAANFLKFGTKVRIPDLFGDRIFIVRDRMNQRYPNRVDIWMLERDDAIQFGIRNARIEIIEIIN